MIMTKTPIYYWMSEHLATFLCVLVAIGITGAPNAQARWTDIESISLGMSLSSGTVNTSGRVIGKSGTTSISVVFLLEKLVSSAYTYVDSWSASSSSSICSSTHQTNNCTGGTFRLSIYGTVTKDYYSEVIEDWSAIKCQSVLSGKR